MVDVLTRYGFGNWEPGVLAIASIWSLKYNTSKSAVFKEGSRPLNISGVWSAIKSKSKNPTLFSSQRLISDGRVIITGAGSTISSKDINGLPVASLEMALHSGLSIFSTLT